MAPYASGSGRTVLDGREGREPACSFVKGSVPAVPPWTGIGPSDAAPG